MLKQNQNDQIVQKLTGNVEWIRTARLIYPGSNGINIIARVNGELAGLSVYLHENKRFGWDRADMLSTEERIDELPRSEVLMLVSFIDAELLTSAEKAEWEEVARVEARQKEEAKRKIEQLEREKRRRKFEELKKEFGE